MEEAHALDIETDGLVNPVPTALSVTNGEEVVSVIRTSDEVDDSEELKQLAREVATEIQEKFNLDGNFLSLITTDRWEGDSQQSGRDMAYGIADVLDNTVNYNADWLVTYNGLAYRGGFDIPALDYAFHRVGMDNPLRGLQHTDVYDVVNRGHVYNTVPEFPSRGGPKKSEMRGAAEMFDLEDEAEGLNKAPLADLLNENLTQEQMQQWADNNGFDLPTTDNESLDAVYEYLFPDEPLPDPFSDSSEAVDAWREEEYADLLVHNISDTLKTIRVFEYVQKSCIPSRLYSPDVLG